MRGPRPGVVPRRSRRGREGAGVVESVVVVHDLFLGRVFKRKKRARSDIAIGMGQELSGKPDHEPSPAERFVKKRTNDDYSVFFLVELLANRAIYAVRIRLYCVYVLFNSIVILSERFCGFICNCRRAK